MNYVVTIFDKNYLVRALALYRSALLHVPDVKFIFIYPDNESEYILKNLNLDKVELIRIDQIPDPEFLKTINNRTPVEFMITAKSCWMKYLLEILPLNKDDVLAFIDPDILFYSSIENTIKKIKDGRYSIAITPHKFQPEKEYMNNKVGKYNAGVIFFRKDDNALKCLSEWREQCINWCHLRYEDGKIGDQMYLNDWAAKHVGVYELPDKGINLGTWNTERFVIKKELPGNFSIDGEHLICYHFHGLKIYLNSKGEIKPYPINVYDKKIYRKYILALQKEYSIIKEVDPAWEYGFAPKLNLLKIYKQILLQRIRVMRS